MKRQVAVDKFVSVQTKKLSYGNKIFLRGTRYFTLADAQERRGVNAYVSGLSADRSSDK
jgi:hypothetical protein